MPKISIVEQDLTTPGVVSDSTDVVYIPGFVNLDQDELYECTKDSNGNVLRGKYIGLEYRKPMLFTRLSDFVTLCGNKPIKFENDQKYSDLSYTFSEKGVPVEDIIIGRGTSDPAYVMAKELLASGLPVMYERINSYDHTTDGYDASKDGSFVKQAVADGEEDNLNYIGRYYYKDSSGDTDVYRLYTDKKDTIPSIPTEGEVYKFEVSAEGTLKLENGVLSLAEEGFNETRYTVTVLTAKARAAISAEEWNASFSSDPNNTLSSAFAKKAKEDIYEVYEKIARPLDKDNAYVFKAEISIATVYSELDSIFSISSDIVSGLIDKGNYNIKYLTSGGYPVFEYNEQSLAIKMMNFAENRGDCVALIDHTDYKDRDINPSSANSVYTALSEDKASFKGSGEFGAMFTPWATYVRTTSDGMEEIDDAEVPYSNTSFRAPASFAYLMALADSIKTNANWLAIAGVTRGGVLNLASGGMDVLIPNGVADAMQPRSGGLSINAITNIAPYGHTIWGNRTLKNNVDNLVATSFLNIRNLVSDVKKTCYRVARSLTFEQDTDVLWINFKSEISKLLNRMVTGYGISGFKILRDTSHEKAAEKATICAKIVLYPTYAVEDFYITIVLKDDEITVE